ncbi:MAG: VacB/RNase II family 3'-5' exoribonuclease [Defluviitaleaceae bacterium]|nr:VacB/RNase II family 3'-5' exoribonuclease [Defluviitaleaceae bacterium]
MRKSKEKIIKGRFVGHPEGYGFVVVEGQTEDIFIPPTFVNSALHEDEVLCRIVPRKEPEPIPAKKKGRRNPKPKLPPKPEPTKRTIGEITEVTHRKPLIGTYFTLGSEGYVRPLEKKIPHVFSITMRNRNRMGLAEGHRVVFSSKPVRVGDSSQLYGHVTDVLGHINDPGVDVLTLVRQANIPYVFPEEALEQAASIPEEITPDDIVGRRDLRNEHIITIDGEDTKDIDDGISLEKTPDGHWRLGVHISDVSHYVKPGTPLDIEALNRGTSVYLADRVIPMLPHMLSSGVCSLFPGVDRLTLSCIMTVDKEGEAIEYEIFPSIINSKRRWTYGEVQEILDSGKDEGIPAQGRDDGVALFSEMNRLREILYKKRQKKGALDFDLPEAKIRVNENGRPVSVEPYPRNQATGIIEEFMILCNETVAAHALGNDIPLIYRAHDAPSPEKLARLQGTAKDFGLFLPHGAGAKAIQKLLESAESSPAYYSIAMAALTSLPQAYYTPDSPKHYGLASSNYCHFTSPIRRYADLQIHRILKEVKTQINANMGEQSAKISQKNADRFFQNHQNRKSNTEPPQNQSLHYIAVQCSRTEREAEALEREVTQLKKVQFMAGDIDRVFEGSISGITAWGIYVILPNTVEGMIPNKQLKILGFVYNKDKNRYESKKSRAQLAMGAKVQVRLLAADEEERRLTFAIENNFVTQF